MSARIHQALFKYGNAYEVKIPGADLDIDFVEFDSTWIAHPSCPKYYNDITTNANRDLVGDLTTFCKANRIPVVLRDYGFITRLGVKMLGNSPISKLELGKSTVLRLDRGGYIGTHRDNSTEGYDMFRVIAPLKNTQSLNTCFMIEGERKIFQEGKFHVFNGALPHSLFHMGTEPSYWLLLNLAATQWNYEFVEAHLRYT